MIRFVDGVGDPHARGDRAEQNRRKHHELEGELGHDVAERQAPVRHDGDDAEDAPHGHQQPKRRRPKDREQVFLQKDDSEDDAEVTGQLDELLGDGRARIAGYGREAGRCRRRRRRKPHNVIDLGVERLRKPHVCIGVGEHHAQRDEGDERDDEEDGRHDAPMARQYLGPA